MKKYESKETTFHKNKDNITHNCNCRNKNKYREEKSTDRIGKFISRLNYQELIMKMSLFTTYIYFDKYSSDKNTNTLKKIANDMNDRCSYIDIIR
jgi:hypothetical protein